jgi:arabinan endo-1,5-alpha-L-arabinosidase
VGGSQDNWNAIDPNVVLDETGTPWLSFGSFWSGIKMVRLDGTGARADTVLHSLAGRPSAGGAIEAPYVVRRCGHYFLFASFDACCRGVDSTYKIAVGRSTAVNGPYLDKAGIAMASGGGSILVQGNTRWRGPGHNAVLLAGDKAYNVYHSYDADANGAATLRISEIAWDQDHWPISGGP